MINRNHSKTPKTNQPNNKNKQFCCFQRKYSKPQKREEPVMVLVVGDRVLHDKFGMGTVISVIGENEKAEATIDFKSAGEKRLLLRYAPVEKL